MFSLRPGWLKPVLALFLSSDRPGCNLTYPAFRHGGISAHRVFEMVIASLKLRSAGSSHLRAIRKRHHILLGAATQGDQTDHQESGSFHRLLARNWCAYQDLNLHGLPHYHLKV